MNLIKIIYLLLLLFGQINAQNYLAYEAKFIDKIVTEEMVRMAEGEANLISLDELEQRNKRATFYGSALCKDRDIMYYLTHGWGVIDEEKSFLDVDYEMLPDISYSVSSLKTVGSPIAFEKLDLINIVINDTVLNIIEEDKLFSKLKKYKIINNNLLVELSPNNWSVLFLRSDKPCEYTTPLGKIFFTNFYQQKEFLGKKYYNIYEYYLLQSPKGACEDFLIWLTDDYSIVRIDDRGGGYLRLEE